MKMRNLMMASLTSVLMTSSFNVLAGTDRGPMTLKLTGVIDMNINPTQVQHINGTLTGKTSFTASPVYADSPKSPWNSAYALISLSQSQTKCDGTFVSKIPGQTDKYGLKLTHSSNPNTAVYVTPQFNFNVNISYKGSNLKSAYSGQFFHDSTDLVDVISPSMKVCFVPSNYASLTVASGGSKAVSVTVPNLFPIYIDNNLTPGKLEYKGTSFYVGSFGGDYSGDNYAQVNVIADVTVKRSCAVTGVSNQQINENMTFTNEVIKDSVFTLSCGGTGNPVNMSAVIKEGSLDPSNVNKLVLAPINGTVSNKKPWVIGLPYKQTSTPNLKCADENNNNLLKFNNTDIELSGTNMGNNQPDIFGIKWALCKPEGTKAGEYRGKVDVNIFVRG